MKWLSLDFVLVWARSPLMQSLQPLWNGKDLELLHVREYVSEIEMNKARHQNYKQRMMMQLTSIILSLKTLKEGEDDAEIHSFLPIPVATVFHRLVV